MTAGEKIKILRLHYNFTQSALAHLLGVSETTIRNYERKKAGIRPRHLEKLVEIFGVDRSAFACTKQKNYVEVMQTLFDMRDENGLCVTTKDNIPGDVDVVLYFKNATIQSAIKAWSDKQKEYGGVEGTDEENRLLAWEVMYPKSHVDEMQATLRMHRKRGKISEEDLKTE